MELLNIILMFLVALFTGISAILIVKDRVEGIRIEPPEIRYLGRLKVDGAAGRNKVRTPNVDVIKLWSGSVHLINNSSLARYVDGWLPALGREDGDGVAILFEGLPTLIPPRSGLSIKYTVCIRMDKLRAGRYEGVVSITYDGRRLKIPYRFEIESSN